MSDRNDSVLSDGNKQRFYRPAYLILVVLGLLIIVLTVSVLMVNLNKNNELTEQIDIEEVVLSGDATVEQINTFVEDIELKINEANNNTEKSSLYAERAARLYNYIDPDDANSETLKNQVLSDAYIAEELAPDVETAIHIYYYENTFGDEEKAEMYHQIAIDRGLNNIKGDG